MGTKKVILDTNFLMVPYKYNLDVLSEVAYLIPGSDFVISKGVVNELKTIATKKGKTGMSARFALKMLKSNEDKITIIPSVESVDRWILSYAKKYRAIVCTDDIKLKNLLRKEKLRVVMVKAKSRVDYV